MVMTYLRMGLDNFCSVNLSIFTCSRKACISEIRTQSASGFIEILILISKLRALLLYLVTFIHIDDGFGSVADDEDQHYSCQ